MFTLPWRSLCPALCLPITLQHPPEYKPILLGIFGVLVERIGKSQDLVGCCSGIYRSVDLLEPGWESFSWFLPAPLLAAMSHAVGNAWLRRYPKEPESRWVFYQELLGCTVAGLLLWITGGNSQNTTTLF